jgi:hypothetical protein
MHGTESFFRKWHSFKWPGYFLYFMRPEVSLSCLQEPVTCPFWARWIHPTTSHHISLTHPCTPWSPKWTLPVRVSVYSLVWIFLSSICVTYPQTCHPPWFVHTWTCPINICFTDCTNINQGSHSEQHSFYVCAKQWCLGFPLNTHTHTRRGFNICWVVSLGIL